MVTWFTFIDTRDYRDLLHDAARPYAVAEMTRVNSSTDDGFRVVRVVSRHASLTNCARKAWRLDREKPVSAPLAALRHHVSGAIERGESQAIVAKD